MRGLYLTLWNTDDSRSGVCKKIKSQASVLTKNGIEMEIVDANSIDMIDTNVFADAIRALFGKNNINWYSIFDVVKKKLVEKKYDVIYVRRPLLDERNIIFYNSIKREYPNLKLLFEIPTYPYDDEIRLSQRIMLRNDKIVRNRLTEFADRIVTYSSDKEIFGVRTINISNGIDYSNFQIRKPLPHVGINVIAIALFEKWHGYDRFLDGMYRQTDIVKENNIHLFLAGKGRVLKQYKADVLKHGLDKHVHFLGEIHGDELNDLYNKSDIALDSMGRHRVGVFYNSSLKGKEYCAFGVPIISGVETELDAKNDFHYYLRIPADDSIIDMNDVVSYYHRCYDKTSPVNVAEQIRNSSMIWFDMEQAFKPVVDFLLKG